MKIAAWNVNSLNVRLPRLLDWLKKQTPDIVCLQETKCKDIRFPQDVVTSGLPGPCRSKFT
jgi:exodeoxyribonuclease-3